MKTYKITLANGYSFIVRDYHIFNNIFYCYYFHNNCWIPTSIFSNNIVKLEHFDMFFTTKPEPAKDPVVPIPLAKVEEDSLRIPINCGSDILINSISGLESITNRSNQFDTFSDSPSFPDISEDWYYSGFPVKLNSSTASGYLPQYIPISFHAIKDGKGKFKLSKLPDRLGYLDSKNNFKESIQWDGPYKKGDLMFTVLLNKDDPSCTDSVLKSTGYWSLLTELSNIKAENGTSKAITLSSGLTKAQLSKLGLSIGYNRTFNDSDNDNSFDSFSKQLSSSFDSNISIYENITNTDVLNFSPKSKEQRVAIYQYIQEFTIVSGGALGNKINQWNNTLKNFVPSFAKGSFAPSSFTFETEYFAKAFILNPDKAEKSDF